MHFIRNNKYVLQCDIKKFYPNIKHTQMKRVLRKKISDRRLMRILDDIIDSTGGDKNIPIGNLTSQWFGNVFLNELDHFVKEQLKWQDYIRYCDDFCLFGNDKCVLRCAETKLLRFVNDELDLDFSKSVVYPVKRGFDFIGYRHFRNFILLRKSTAKRIKKRVLNIAVHNDLSEHSVGQLSAVHGWMCWANSYRYKQKIQYMVDDVGGNISKFVRANI